jgi:hypothetical protein
MSAAPATTPQKSAPSLGWDPRLPLDIALDIEEPDALCVRYGITLDVLNDYMCRPAFHLQVAQFKKELQETGEGFKAKARVQAEQLMDTSFAMAQNPETPASVRADLIKATVEWAGLKPTGKNTGDTGGGFSITFNFPLPSGAPAPSGPIKAPVTLDHKQG